MVPYCENEDVAEVLERVADLLDAQGADAFRVRAWRQAAQSVRRTDEPLEKIFHEQGVEGLDRLPGVGRSIAGAIRELLSTGRLGMLERLRGEVPPEGLLATVPGIGAELAERIHRQLGVETLEALELAAHDGRLAQVDGFGPRRVRAVQESLAGMLSRSARRRVRREVRGEAAPPEPPVALLLDVDAEYRRRAEAGELRRIAPRRFNPTGEAWLPVLHAAREGWHFTALYSNTARAHELGATRDWVVVYFERDGHEEQGTVVTETRGALAGRRVVRGREAECREHYAHSAA
jgi:DNA uptake protein ComE-like DNA-binding protein